jgi:hypothetical protein
MKAGIPAGDFGNRATAPRAPSKIYPRKVEARGNKELTFLFEGVKME